jgi:hypothetical protein
LPLAVARRALTVLIAVAVAVFPLGAATAGLHAPTAKAVTASAHQGHAKAHDHSAMKMTATSDRHGAGHCDRKAADSNCCDDKGTCAQTCLQKCFGPLAVLLPGRTARLALANLFATLPAAQPPGWSLTPQPPPPRA